MAIVKYTWNAPLIAQVMSFTPGGTIAVGNTFTITIGGKSLTYTATGTTVASVTAGFAALLQACAYPEFLEVTWADGTTTITATATQAGRHVEITASKAQGAGGTNTHTFVAATVTANSGPEDVICVENYSSGTVPVDGDTIVLENSSQSLKYNLGGLSLDNIKIHGKPTFTGEVGLPEVNQSGYDEYRPTYWELGLTSIEWESPSARAKFYSAGATAAGTLYVKNTGQPAEAGIPALLIKGFSNTYKCTASITKGSVGFAFFPGETCYLAAGATVGYQTSQAGDSNVVFGPGVIFSSTYAVTGGKVQSQTSLSTITVYGGTVTVAKGAVSTKIENRGGTVIYASTSTPLAKYIGYAGTTLDLRQVLATLVITEGEFYPTAAVLGGENFVSFGSLKIFGGDIRSVQLPAWKNIAVSVSAL